MEIINLQNWKFFLENGPDKLYLDRWNPGFDDNLWENVIIPHDWAVSFPFSVNYSSGTGYLPGGTGWYRTIFRIPENWDGKQAFIYFDGIYKNSQVWCNGNYLGKRPFGYIGFRYDISHCLRKGENIIAVKVSHEDYADSRWYTGSGICRKAFVIFYDSLFIDEYTMIIKSEYSDDEASVQVSGKIYGDYKGNDSLQLNAFLAGKNKNPAVKIQLPLNSGPKQSDCPAGSQSLMNFLPFDINIKVREPALWSPEAPNLYELRLELEEKGSGKIISAARPVRTGIRTIKFDPDKGFFLNGKPLKIKGVCVHHDAGCLGAAVWPEVWQRRLEKLKCSGCNAIRTSHNPHMNELYDLCDEMGFLVMDEAFDEWEGCKNKWTRGHNVYPPVHQGYAMDFSEWHGRDLQDMVIRDRNHPSVIMWSIGNEIDYPNDPYVHPMFEEMSGNNDANKPRTERIYNPDKPNMERLSQIAPELVKIVKRNDETRPVLLAAAFPELSSHLGLFDALDMAGYNYREQYYSEDHRRFPDLPIIGSENSHSVAAWKAVEKNDFISGQFLWTGIDYLGEARGWPIRGSGAGLLDLAGNEKIAYYRRMALWSNEPIVYLASCPGQENIQEETPPWKLQRSWDYARGELVEVVCYTNLDKAELFCNGKSRGIGDLHEDCGYISWLVPFERGILTVKGTGGNAPVSDSIESTFPPVQLRLCVWKGSSPEPVAALPGKYRIVQIEAEMLDEAGRLSPGAGQIVTVTLEGGGIILGMENGDLSDCTEYCARARRLYRGRLVIYVLLSEYEKNVSLTAAAEGMRPVKMQLRS